MQTISFDEGFLRDRYLRLGRLDIMPPWHAAFYRRLPRKRFLWRWRRIVSQFRPQLLYVNSVVMIQGARSLGVVDVPVLVHIHELDSFMKPFLESNRDRDLLLTWPTRFIAVSEAVRELLVKSMGIPEEKVGLVYEFIRDEVLSFGHPQPPSATDRRGRPFVIGGAGTPGWRKGVTLWLQTAAAVKRLLPGMALEFRWVGMMDNPYADTTRLEAKKLGVEDIVRFMPRMERPLDQFEEFDVFAMTSWEDPCPLVVLENMALGKPVVCFQRGGGAAEEVGNGGIVVPEFRPEMMAQAIAELAKDDSRREALGKIARSRVKEKFMVSVQAPKLLAEMRRTAAKDGVYV